MSMPSQISPDIRTSPDEFEDASMEFFATGFIPRFVSLKMPDAFKPNFLKESNPLYSETRELRKLVEKTYSDHNILSAAAAEPGASPSTSLVVHRDIASILQQPLEKTMADGVSSGFPATPGDLPNSNPTIVEANNVQTLVDTPLTSAVTNKEEVAVVPGFNVPLPLDQLADFIEKWLTEQSISHQLSPPEQKLKRSNVVIHCMRHAQVSTLITMNNFLLEKKN